MMHFSLMILMAHIPYFPQLFDSQLSQIIKSMPAWVVAVCNKCDCVCEYCALNSFAISLILLNSRFVVLYAKYYLCFHMVYMQQTKELFITVTIMNKQISILFFLGKFTINDNLWY